MNVSLKILDVEVTIEHSESHLTINNQAVLVTDMAYSILQRMLADRVNLGHALGAETADPDGDRPPETVGANLNNPETQPLKAGQSEVMYQ